MENNLTSVNGNPNEAYQRLDCNFASTSKNNGTSSPEICDFTSEATLNFLKQMLLEEDINDKVSTYQEEVSLRATEKSFYDVLGEDYPSSSCGYLLQNTNTQENHNGYPEHEKSSMGATSELEENDLCCKLSTDMHSVVRKDPILAVPVEIFPATTSVESLLDGKIQNIAEVVNRNPKLTVPTESFLARQIQKGAEEAMQFLPKIDNLFIGMDECEFQQVNEWSMLFDKGKGSSNYPRTRKKTLDDNIEVLNGRNNKQITLCTEEPEKDEISDKVLLILGPNYSEEITNMQEIIKKELKDETWQNDVQTYIKTMIQDNKTHAGYGDIIMLLMYCSQAISTNDFKTGLEMITQLKEHASPNGSWFERLAYYFVDGLYARLSGTVSEIYRKITTLPSFIDNLKAYYLYVATCPFKKALFSFANQSIFNISKNASKIHIISYGVIHGFQWPSYFERFGKWNSPLPKIRMTLIEVPESGFRPTKLLDSTARRLAFYAKSYNVPFECQVIASKWENVKPKDFNISDDELVIVNCIGGFTKLSDEAVASDSPRDNFLKTIRSIKPCIFVHGVVNGSFSSPFFTVRFKSVLSQFSTMFDMLGSIMPQDNPERLRIERDLLAPWAINAIACEGPERIVRPETYRQWQRRYLRAGFVQALADSVIVKNIKDFVKDYYHKEFLIQRENGWLLMGWKGRILFAQSAWIPDEQ